MTRPFAAFILLAMSAGTLAAQAPSVDQCVVITSDTLRDIRHLQDVKNISFADPTLGLRIANLSTSSLILGTNPGGAMWYTDTVSPTPVRQTMASATDEAYLIAYARSGAQAFRSIGGGVQTVSVTELRQVTETVQVPVTKQVTETIMTPDGPKKVTKTVTVMEAKTVTKNVPVTKYVSQVTTPPRDQLDTVINALRAEPNEMVRKSLERLAGARFASQYPPGMSVPGAEPAIELANQYRKSVVLEARTHFEKSPESPGIGVPFAFGPNSPVGTRDLLSQTNGKIPNSTFTAKNNLYAVVWSGSTAVVVRVPATSRPGQPVALSPDWKSALDATGPIPGLAYPLLGRVSPP